MFPRLTELLLIGCSIESMDPKIQIKYTDTRNQLADMLTKGNFTRDEWNHLLCLFIISHFSSAECSEVMSRRTQKESGEERVAAKSRPMMNLIARSSERAPSAPSFSSSGGLGKTRQENQRPLSAEAEMYDRTEKHVVCRDTSHECHRLVEKAHSSSYSEWNIDKTWSSHEWKSDELIDDRTERPVDCSQHTDQFVSENNETNSYTEAESELSLGSRSFLHSANDQVRTRPKTTLNECNRRQRQTVCDKENVHVFDTASICIHGEELLRQFAFHQEFRRSHNETGVRHI